MKCEMEQLKWGCALQAWKTFLCFTSHDSLEALNQVQDLESFGQSHPLNSDGKH